MESHTQVLDESKKEPPKQQTKGKILVKNLKVYKKPNTMLYNVMYEGGGELPKELQGSWNSVSAAEKAVEIYKINRQAGTR
jgi:hypothetical protein